MGDDAAAAAVAAAAGSDDGVVAGGFVATGVDEEVGAEGGSSMTIGGHGWSRG